MARKDIHKDGVKTQFKKGHRHSIGRTTNTSIRAQLQWVRDQNIDMSDLDNEIKRLLKTKAHKGKSMTNGARLIAVRAFEKLVKKMDANMFEKFINQTEGNLSQTIDLPSSAPAPTDSVTPEAAAAAYLEYISK